MKALPSLQQVQEMMFQNVFGEQGNDDPAWNLYGKMSRNSMAGVLDALYPVTRELYSVFEPMKSWEDLKSGYFKEVLPSDFRINSVGKEFPDWLNSHPALKEMADYEWARFQAISSRDPEEGDWVNPTLVLRCYEFPIPQWYRDQVKEKKKISKKDT